jgi:glycerol-3-phosphate acyltransferase PlsY
VLRSGNKGAALATLLLDAVKGWLPVFLIHLGIEWLLGLATGTTWLIIAVFFRYSSLASIVAAFFAPAYYLIGGGIAWPRSREVLLSLIAISLLLIWRHRENIRRLAAGTESRLGSKTRTQE